MGCVTHQWRLNCSYSGGDGRAACLVQGLLTLRLYSVLVAVMRYLICENEYFDAVFEHVLRVVESLSDLKNPELVWDIIHVSKGVNQEIIRTDIREHYVEVFATWRGDGSPPGQMLIVTPTRDTKPIHTELTRGGVIWTMNTLISLNFLE